MDESFNPYAAPQSSVMPPALKGVAPPLASRWHRFLAMLLDTLILMAVVLPLEWMTGSFERSMQASNSVFIFHAEDILWSAVSFGVWMLLNWQHLLTGQTIGKRALHLKVVRKDGSSCDRNRIILWRTLPPQVAIFIPFIGILLVLADALSIFRPSRHMLHDDIADTKVIDLRQQLIFT